MYIHTPICIHVYICIMYAYVSPVKSKPAVSEWTP